MKEFLVFGDIAGRYDEMLKIIDKAPKCTPVSVGDMMDRGPKSKQVLDYFMNNGTALMGNHEHLMIDFYENNLFYDHALWPICNGGWKTIESYMDPNEKYCFPSMIRTQQAISKNKQGQYIADGEWLALHHDIGNFMRSIVDRKYIKWLKSLPLYIESDDYIISHAAINPSIPFDRCLDINFSNIDNTILWNRGSTRRRKDDKFQIHGHMANNKALALEDKDGMYGMNLDSSRGGVLTAMHYPTFKLYTQAYLPEELQ